MNDYLGNLVARQLGTAEVLRPRIVARFEPPVGLVAPEAPTFAEAARPPGPEPAKVIAEVERQAVAAGVNAERCDSAAVSAPRTRPLIPETPAQSVPTPRAETARDASLSPRTLLSTEPLPEDDTAHAETPRGRQAHRTPPPKETPQATHTPTHDISTTPPYAPYESPAVRAPTRPRNDEGLALQKPTLVNNESAAPVRASVVVPDTAAEPKPVTSSPVYGEPHGRKAESNAKSESNLKAGPDTPADRSNTHASSTPGAGLLVTTVRPPAGRRGTPPPPEPHVAPRPAEKDPPRRDDATTPTAETTRAETTRAEMTRAETTPPARRTALELPAPAEPPAHLPVAVAPEPKHGRERPRETLTIEPLISRRAPQRPAAHVEARASTEAAPTINVTIGRVEVRATHAPPATARRAGGFASLMSLDDYLRRRGGGGTDE